jgi:post-segregation antitoxin (ccd killing protein)
MAKGFTKNNPLDKLAGTTEPKEVGKKSAGKRKPGRPTIDGSGRKKKDYTKTINVAVPLDLLEKADVAKVCYSNNLTEYINKLIERDIETNYDSYKRIADSLNSFK